MAKPKTTHAERFALRAIQTVPGAELDSPRVRIRSLHIGVWRPLKETGTQLEQRFCFGLLLTVLRSESTNNSYISLISPRDIHMTMPRDTQRVQSKVGYSSFTRNHVALRSPLTFEVSSNNFPTTMYNWYSTCSDGFISFYST